MNEETRALLVSLEAKRQRKLKAKEYRIDRDETLLDELDYAIRDSHHLGFPLWVEVNQGIRKALKTLWEWGYDATFLKKTERKHGKAIRKPNGKNLCRKGVLIRGKRDDKELTSNRLSRCVACLREAVADAEDRDHFPRFLVAGWNFDEPGVLHLGMVKEAIRVLRQWGYPAGWSKRKIEGWKHTGILIRKRP